MTTATTTKEIAAMMGAQYSPFCIVCGKSFEGFEKHSRCAEDFVHCPECREKTYPTKKPVIKTMTTIYKYPLEVTDVQSLELPKGYEILSVGEQGGGLVMWAEVDPEQPLYQARIRIVGTGQPISPVDRQFIGTVQIGMMAWHVFEVAS